MSAKERNEIDFDYLKLRREFEQELRAQGKRGGGGAEHDESGIANFSVVGSNMSQIESVSMMSGPSAVKANARKAAELMGQLQLHAECDEENLVDDNNNQANGVALANLMREAQANKPLVNESQRRQEHLDELLKDYTVFDELKYSQLPILKVRKEILETVAINPFVVIEGGTGCGKTTQVPQYILDDHMARKKFCNIIGKVGFIYF